MNNKDFTLDDLLLDIFKSFYYYFVSDQKNEFKRRLGKLLNDLKDKDRETIISHRSKGKYHVKSNVSITELQRCFNDKIKNLREEETIRRLEEFFK